MLIVVVILAVVGVGLAGALGDRLAAARAERAASSYLAALSRPTAPPPLVRVGPGSFLLQAVRGRYGEIRMCGGGLRLGDMTGATLDVRLHGVRLPLRELLGGRAEELPCDRIEGEIVLPFGELARVSHVLGLSLDYRDGRLVAAAALPVPGISALARVSGEATLSIAENGLVWLRLGGVSVAGISLPRLVLDQLLGTLSFPVPMPPLPFGLVLTRLEATRDGLLVGGSARHVTFRPPPPVAE